MDFHMIIFLSFNYLFVANGEETYWWRAAVDPLLIHINRHGYYVNYLKNNPSYRDYIRKSVHVAASECKRLFQDNRWNCMSKIQRKPFGDIVDIGCRETAFIYALTSASLTFHMIHACSQGRIPGCYNRCIKPEDINPKLTRLLNSTHSRNEACDDNRRFGTRTWTDFVLKGEQSSDIRARFNVRNSQVGLQEVHNSAALSCRCHGVSGSCVLQICSEKIAENFRDISNQVYRQYKEAKFDTPSQKLIEENSKQLNRNSNSISDTNRRRGKRNLITNLEFFDYSPNFCQKSKYSFGIKNRSCRPYVSTDQYRAGDRSCDELCCYGRSSRTVDKIIRSNCRFIYCCEVKCKEDKKRVEEFYCL